MSAGVVVTGLGAISPHGDDSEALFDALWRGTSAIAPIFPELIKPGALEKLVCDSLELFRSATGVRASAGRVMS